MRVAIGGGGISGLSLAWSLLKRDPSLEVIVLESEAAPGGKIRSDRIEGYLCEWGVNGFLDNKPGTLQLAEALGLPPVRSSDDARKRFVYADGRLHRLPESPPAFLKSALMSWGGKFRLALEPFIAKGTVEDESLAEFGRRRLGAEAFQKLIDPMASGIFAGDPERLSLKSCFPRIHELEQTYGSLIKAMISLMKERKKKVDAGPGGALTSFHDGMGSVIQSLMRELGGRVRTSAAVESIAPAAGGGWSLALRGGETVECDVAVLAAPAHAQTGILRELDAVVSRALAQIPYPSLSVVCTGFELKDVNIPVDCFGYLVPGRERRKVLGTLYDSSVFPNRAPEGHVLLRSMVGGARASDVADLEDGKLLDTVMQETRTITGLRPDPVFVKIYRHPRAIAQYNVGHGRILSEVDAFEQRHRGVYLSGNAYRGVSVNDCIFGAEKLAVRILEEMGGEHMSKKETGGPG